MNKIDQYGEWTLYFDTKLGLYELSKDNHHVNFWCDDNILDETCVDIIKMYEGCWWPFNE